MSTTRKPTRPDVPAGMQGILLQALEQSPLAMLIFRADGDMPIVWRNATHAIMTDTTGRTFDGMPLFEAFPPSQEAEGAADAQAPLLECVARLRAGGAPETLGPVRFDLRAPDGVFAEHHWRIQMSGVEGPDGVEAILQVAQDVTETVLADRLADSLQRAAQETAAIAPFRFDPETGLFDRAPAVDAMFGFASGEMGQDAGPFFSRVHPDDLPGVYAEVERVFDAPRGDVASFDYRVPQPDGTERFIRIRGEVAVDPGDRREKLVGTFVDLTDLHRDRAALAAALAFQETLVAEANHRVKNSLSIVRAMLSIERRGLQGRAGDGATVKDAVGVLDGVAGRIQAIADAHGLMQFDGGGTRVSLASLAQRVEAQVGGSAGLGADALRCTPPARDVTLDSDTAVTLGLVLNEMTTNALKYGLHDGPGTDIRIGFDVGDDRIAVTVENAVARSGAAVDTPSGGLGRQLLDQLAGQIDATLETEQTDGRYRATLSLPVPEPAG